jgi:hypothetical protein
MNMIGTEYTVVFLFSCFFYVDSLINLNKILIKLYFISAYVQGYFIINDCPITVGVGDLVECTHNMSQTNVGDRWRYRR